MIAWPGRVVQVAGDARALLGGRQAALALASRSARDARSSSSAIRSRRSRVRSPASHAPPQTPAPNRIGIREQLPSPARSRSRERPGSTVATQRERGAGRVRSSRSRPRCRAPPSARSAARPVASSAHSTALARPVTRRPRAARGGARPAAARRARSRPEQVDVAVTSPRSPSPAASSSSDREHRAAIGVEQQAMRRSSLPCESSRRPSVAPAAAASSLEGCVRGPRPAGRFRRQRRAGLRCRMNVIETRGADQALRRAIVAVDDLDLRVRRGEVYGFLGPERRGQDDDAADAARAGATDVGRRRGARRARRAPGGPGPHRRDGRGAGLLPVPVGPRQPAGARRATPACRAIAHRRRCCDEVGLRAARGDRFRDLLAGDEAAARRRRRAAQGPRAADPRRADQRARPGRHGRDADVHPRARPSGDRTVAALQPPDGGGRAGLRPGRRHPRRRARRRGHRRRAARPRRPAGAAPSRSTRPRACSPRCPASTPWRAVDGCST